MGFRRFGVSVVWFVEAMEAGKGLTLLRQRENLSFLTGLRHFWSRWICFDGDYTELCDEGAMIIDKHRDGVWRLIREEVWWTEKYLLGAGLRKRLAFNLLGGRTKNRAGTMASYDSGRRRRIIILIHQLGRLRDLALMVDGALPDGEIVALIENYEGGWDFSGRLKHRFEEE